MLHKRIAHHTKRYVSHVTKYLYERDTILSLLMVFLFIIIVKAIPWNLHALDTLKLALKDFDFNDMVYAKKLDNAKETKGDANIVIVNIGHIDRAEIAMLIDKVSSMGPKVMGLDAYFEGTREADKDSLLRSVFEKTKNLVVVSRFDQEHLHHNGKFEFMPDYFDSSMQKRGYANLIGEEGGTIRLYSPFEKVEGEKYPSFTSEIVKLYDEKAYRKLEKRHKEVEIINYAFLTKQYQIVQSEDVMMMNNIDTGLFRNKIALLAYINENPEDIEDKKFTPMNEKIAGKSTPDMNGIVVHANIISMELNGHYIKKMPSWVAWLVAIFIGWLHMSLFIRYYLESHIWFHLVAKIAQLISAIFFVYLGVFLFEKLRIKLDMELTLIVIVLSVDIIYFYEALATWMHKKYKFATVFTHHHHPDEGQEHTNQHEHH